MNLLTIEKQGSYRKKIFNNEDKNSSLLKTVLIRNYKLKIIEEATMKRKLIEPTQTHQKSSFRQLKSLNYGLSKRVKPDDLLENYKKLEEKTNYINQLEREFNEAKTKRQKTEDDEEKFELMLKENKSYLISLCNQFKIISSVKNCNNENEKEYREDLE